MTMIGRDHGKLRHEVAMLPITELVWYAANYQYESEEAEKEATKNKQK